MVADSDSERDHYTFTSAPASHPSTGKDPRVREHRERHVPLTKLALRKRDRISRDGIKMLKRHDDTSSLRMRVPTILPIPAFRGSLHSVMTLSGRGRLQDSSLRTNGCVIRTSGSTKLRPLSVVVVTNDAPLPLLSPFLFCAGWVPCRLGPSSPLDFLDLEILN
jgi:hypothetical protein